MGVMIIVTGVKCHLLEVDVPDSLITSRITPALFPRPASPSVQAELLPFNIAQDLR